MKHPNRPRRLTGALVSAAMIGSLLGGVGTAAAVTEEDPSFRLIRSDLEHILKQIKIAEEHVKGGDLLCEEQTDLSGTCVPSPLLPWGLRTVDGTWNNLQPGQSTFGAAGKVFPRLLEPEFKDAENLPFDPDGPAGPAQAGVPTSYKQKNGFVADSEPRTISNLIVDSTAANPAALEAAANVPNSEVLDHDGDPSTPDRVFIPNESPDEGLSAPFSGWFTIFGQFFDHGLDLVSKGGSGTVAVPLMPDDPLYVPGARTNFIMLTRATNQAGPDGVLGTADDVQEHVNRTTPFIDQNQTYTSHPSHQVFLREYEATPEGPVPTGHLLDGAAGGTPTWNEVKAQAKDVLGIELDDMDAMEVPLVATDPYGRFLPGADGFPQLVVEGTPNSLVEGDPAAPADATQAMGAGVAFLDDIANGASPDIKDNPATPQLEEYDAAKLGAHYITGDGRGNENIALTAVHHVFHSEHNRVADEVVEILEADGNEDLLAEYQDTSGPWDLGERVFQAARFVTEMEYQHLVFEEFARTIQPTIDAQPLNETAYHSDIDPAVTAEFAHVVYRFGHSMLTDEVAREGFDTESLPLLDAFLNPAEFTDDGRLTADQGAAAIIQGMAKQTGSGIDEFVVDTLRNELLGLPLDLAAINMARARDTGVPSLQAARRTFFEATNDSALEPYESWEDFRLSMKNRGSIVNFVAAYGNHPSVQEATTVAAKREAAMALVGDPDFMNLPSAESGLDDVDFWIGGLAEQAMVFGGMLGTTFNAVFEDHMEDLQNGDRFYYLNRTQGMNLIHQLEANSFSELVMRNTDASLLPHDIFASPDNVFDLANLSDPLPAGFSRMNDGTYRYDGPEHVVIHGTDADEGIRGGDGDDSIWGHDGVDRLEGGIGNDNLVGGKGDDILTDLFGDDIIFGDDGNDAINSGAGADLIFSGFGKDFVHHGNEITESFAGGGDDLIRGGNANDIQTGNEGDDWLEGNGGHDLVQGDNALTFQNDPNGGADVLFGGSGNDDHDAEGGDDVMLNNGIDRHAGMLGFDWVTHKHDPVAAHSDLDVSVFQPLNVTYMRSRFLNVEGLSGWDKADVLRGQSDPGDPAIEGNEGHELGQDDLDRIGGLRDLLGGGDVPKYATPFLATNQANDIILGGGESDLLEGRGGDDYLDGDAKLDVYLVGPGGERQESMQPFQQRVFNGELSPADIHIVREVVTTPDQEGVVDTAFYEDVMANHTVTDNNDGTWRVAHVEQDAGGLASGVDTLRNIERIQFADGTLDLVELENGAAYGTIDFSTLSPVEDQPITAIRAFNDPQGIQEDTITYTWEWADDEGEWTASVDGVGATFTPGDAEAGWPIRVVATFLDGEGTMETITSQPTLPVQNVNDVPTGLVVSNTTPEVGDVVSATGLVDPDGTHNDDGDAIVDFRYQWQQEIDGAFADIAGATSESFTVAEAQDGRRIRVIVSYTDVHGTPERVTSPATAPVGGAPAPLAQLVDSSLDFGQVEVGTTATRTVQVTNAGNAPLKVSIASASQSTGGAAWSTTTPFDSCAVVAPQGTCEIELRVTPSAPGAFSTQLAITTDGGNLTLPVTGEGVAQPTGPVFSDVAGTPHAADILKVAEAGIAGGFTDGTFRPAADVTRGQMATFIAKAAGLTVDGTGPTFSDLEGSVHADAIRAVAEAGIAGGFRDGTFRPDAKVTRGQMATFLAKALDLPEGPLGSFPDVAGHTHERSIGAIKAAGITSGKADGTFAPDDAVTRGQMATFIAKAWQL